MTVLGAALTLLLTAAPSPQAALEALKSLEGNWKAQQDGGVSQIQYRIVGDGAAVMELALAADGTRIVTATLFRIDGTDLVAERYGTAGAPQRLKLEKAAAGADGTHSLIFGAPPQKDARVQSQPLLLRWTKDGALSRKLGAEKGNPRFEREYVDRLK